MTELQKKLLELLKTVDEICRKHGIEYYLLGGTLIGAMRHRGFIPWDDDADVIMTRDNWKRFYSIAPDELPERYKISSQDDDINVGMTINRLTETTSTGFFRYHLGAPEVAGTQIDIFILDPVPDTDEAKTIYRDAITEYTEVSALHAAYQFRNGKNSNFISNWKKCKSQGKEKTLRQISETAFNYKEEESQLYAQRFAGAPHFWPKEVFGKPKYVRFEDTYFPVPQRPSDCLTIGYDDDWKYVPRSGDALSAHTFAARNFTTPSTVIWNDYINRVDHKKLMDAFVDRKYAWDRQFDQKFDLELDTQYFLKTQIELKYKKRLTDLDIEELLDKKKYDVLLDFFEEYLKHQSSGKIVGSSSLSGWIQYYRRNHRLLIDIGDEAIYAVLKTLMHYQRLAPVVKIMDARTKIDRPLTKDLEFIKESIPRIRRIISTYDCEEYDKCRELVEEGLDREPDNPFYIKHDVLLKIKDGATPMEIEKALDDGLSLVGGDPDLLFAKSEIMQERGDIEDAKAIYDKLIEETDNGIVLNNIKDICGELYETEKNDENYERLLRCRKSCGENVDPGISDIDNEDGNKDEVEYGELTDIQRCRLDLMKELDDICRKNGLSYYLAGRMLWQACEYEKYIDEYGGMVVFMEPEHALRFQEIVNSGDNKGRVVESMLNNPDFYRICMRFCNTETLDLIISRCHSTLYPGIGVTIEILRPKERNRLHERYHRFLEKAWESQSEVKNTDLKTKLSLRYIRLLRAIYGKEKSAGLVFSRLTDDSAVSDKEFFVKRYNLSRKYFPAEIFANTSDVILEGNVFKTASDPEGILSIQQGRDWSEKEYVETSINEYTRILDGEIGVEEYMEYLKEKGIDTDSFQRRWRKNNWDYNKITKVSKLSTDHWYILAACCDRYNMHDIYHSKKNEIIDAYNKQEVGKVGEMIQAYYDKANEYLDRKIALYFDRELFDVILWYMEQKDKGQRADKLRRLAEEQKWTEISGDTEER